jgi:hypothetical protein
MAGSSMRYDTHAVSDRRIEPKDSRDELPNPPWATRALLEYVIDKASVASLTCLEPACGAATWPRS